MEVLAQLSEGLYEKDWTELSQRTILLGWSLETLTPFCPNQRKGEVMLKGKDACILEVFLENNNLYDLGFRGPSFRWQQGRNLELLDRAICNEA